MAATSTFKVADNSALKLHYHMTGSEVPSAFETSTYGCRVHLSDASSKYGRLDAGWTGGAYLGYSNGRHGRIYQFAYTSGGNTYTLNLTEDDIAVVEQINKSEQ